MLWQFIIKKALGNLTDIDFDRPSSKCGRCGHQAYFMNGEIDVDVCPWCKIMRILIALRLPEEYFNVVISGIEDRKKIKL